MWSHALLVVVGSFAGLNHGNHPHEWGGLFELSVGDYIWTFHKNGDGVYGANDESMNAVVLRDSPDTILETHHNEAEALLRQSCLPVLSSTSLYPGDACVDLVFNYSSNETLFYIKIAIAGRFVVFTEHHAHEFLADVMRTSCGFVVRPIATYDHEITAHDHETTAHDHETTAHDYEVDPIAAVALGISLISLPPLCILLIFKCRETTNVVATPREMTMELHTDPPVSIESNRV